MIVFAKLSERRFLVLSVPAKETGWAVAVGRLPSLGYKSAQADVIAGPVNREDAQKYATEYAAEHNALLTNEQWRAEVETREREVRAEMVTVHHPAFASYDQFKRFLEHHSLKVVKTGNTRENMGKEATLVLFQLLKSEPVATDYPMDPTKARDGTL